MDEALWAFELLQGLDDVLHKAQSLGKLGQEAIKGGCLTLSFPMGQLWGILTLAMYISPNNGLIDLLLNEEMIVYVLKIHFAL